MPECQPRDPVVGSARPPTENPKPGNESTNADGIGRCPAMCQRIGQQRQQLQYSRAPGDRALDRWREMLMASDA